MRPIRIMAASGMLGYGFTEKAFNHGLSLGIDLIACDAGSADPGPYYLGSGTPFVSRIAVKRDLSLMIRGGTQEKIPVFIGSAGGSGSDKQVDWTLEIIREICDEQNIYPKVAVLRTELRPEQLVSKINSGKISPLGPIKNLNEKDANETHKVVSMIGAEPFQQALEEGADIVIAGRSSDAAIYAALPLMRGADPGLSWHMGKIIECGAQVIEPREGQDCVIGTIYHDYFTIEPGHPDRRCTRTRVAAHTLYENPSPYELKEPSGTLITKSATFEQIDDRVVRVSGSKWEPSSTYTVKLEGVKKLGFRTVFLAGTRDPILVSGINNFIEACQTRIERDSKAIGIEKKDYMLNIKVYGKDAVMGANEPLSDQNAHEVGILVDVVAKDQDISKAVCAKARYSLLHTDFPGRMCISGNLAIPFSPSDLSAGEVYEFNIWHIMECNDPMEPVRMELIIPNDPPKVRLNG